MPKLLEDDLITIRLVSREPTDESELKRYLEEALGIKVLQQLTESAHWSEPILVIAKSAVPVALYAGKKLTDLLIELLREYMKRKSSVSEIVLYDAEGNEIKIPRK
jgi:hypothetical protein